MANLGRSYFSLPLVPVVLADPFGLGWPVNRSHNGPLHYPSLEDRRVSMATAALSLSFFLSRTHTRTHTTR